MSGPAAAAPGLDGSGMRIGVIRSTFNPDVTDGLLAGALEVIAEAGAEAHVVDVPGTYEVPLVAQRLAAHRYDALVAVGAVILGETDHYDHVAHRASEGIMRVMLDTGIPVAFGILTVRELRHAVERSAPGPANKGAEAARAAIATALLLRQLG